MKNWPNIQYWQDLIDYDKGKEPKNQKEIKKHSRFEWLEKEFKTDLEESKLKLTDLKKEHALDQVRELEGELEGELPGNWSFENLKEQNKAKVTFLIQLLFEDTEYDCGFVDSYWWL